MKIPLSGAGPALNRRQLLIGTGALLGGALTMASLSGCQTPGAGAAQNLRFWHLLSGGDGIKMQGMIDAANAQNPDFTVTPTVLAWGAPTTPSFPWHRPEGGRRNLPSCTPAALWATPPAACWTNGTWTCSRKTE
ncbi:hypothetical protein OL239_10115 [Arthrobacter sp. ATA002]|nr:hypothetical protein [Arthrobacter sp. ATA002]WAP50428.1 hypothetical protein OL239_10115 [Arthrobacter sp. ATA002]